ncbi:tetratricopeptide repeat protein [Candidatus Woesearchaeota archaeon]|nr:tetratricopeptide repeat protein [Candidatus Woesearchaeota archaeon]
MASIDQIVESGIFSQDTEKKIHLEFIPFTDTLCAEHFVQETYNPLEFYSPKMDSVIEEYVQLAEDASDVVEGLLKMQHISLLKTCIEKAGYIQSTSMELTLKRLLEWFKQRENLIASTIQACARRGDHDLEKIVLNASETATEAYYKLGLLYFTLDDLDSAEKYFNLGLKNLEKQKSIMHADLLYQLARVHRSVSKSQEAKSTFDEAIRIYENIPGEKALAGKAHSLLEIALIDRWQIRKETPPNLIKEAMDIFKGLKDDLNYSRCLIQLGNYYNYRDDFEKAAAAYDESLPVLRKFNYTRGIAEVYMGISRIRQKRGQFEEAEKICLESLAMTQGLGYKRRIGYVYQRLASIYHDKGDQDKALDYAKATIDIWKSCRIVRGIAMVLRTKAQIFESLGNYRLAYYNYKGCVNIRRRLELSLLTSHDDYEKRLSHLRKMAGINADT